MLICRDCLIQISLARFTLMVNSAFSYCGYSDVEVWAISALEGLGLFVSSLEWNALCCSDIDGTEETPVLCRVGPCIFAIPLLVWDR